MKQNFKHKEVIKFANQLKAEYDNGNIDNIFSNWQAYIERHLVKLITTTKRNGAKLDSVKVKKIKILLEAGAAITDIAKRYNVSLQCISSIKRKKTWVDITID